MNSRIGIYPGTFDPLHDGHVAFAKQAQTTLSLNIVYFIPERVHQTKVNVSDFYARIDFIQEKIQKFPQFEVIELKSVPQTMDAVKSELPGLFAGNEVVMLIGSDTLRGLKNWVGIETFLQEVELCIGLRGDDTDVIMTPYVTALEQALGHKIEHTFVTTNFKDVSSKKIRELPGYEPL